MAMPRKLKLMNVFLNGYSYQGVAKSVTLPKLTRKLENYRGAGMNGSAPVDLGLDDDALSMEWSLGGFPDSVIWELYAATGVDAVPIRFAGSYQRDDTSATIPAKRWPSKWSCVDVRKKSTPARANREKTPSRKSPWSAPISG